MSTVESCICDAAAIQDYATSFKESTGRTEPLKTVLERLAKFFRFAVADFREPEQCICEYSDASLPAWEKLLTTMYRIVRHLRDNAFDELQILYEDPSENNAVKACVIYSIMVTMLDSISDFQFFLFERLLYFHRSKYHLIERYIMLIKESLVIISSNHRSICLEKYEKYFGNRSTDRSRIIDCVTNTFGLI